MNKKNNRKSIGARIKEARLRAGLTQEQAASLIGLSQGTISLQESGKRRISADTAEQLIEFYEKYYKRNSEKKEISSAVKAAQMLLDLAALGGEELKTAVDNYLSVNSYLLIRSIYTSNPQNSDRPFSLSTEAFNMLNRVISEEPERIMNFVKYSKKVKSTEIRPDPELAYRLREIIDECEDMIKKNDT